MPVTCLVSTHFCFLECPGITAAIELRFMSCMHLSCLPWAGVGISWVWKPRATAALMVQIEFLFSWVLSCTSLHKGYVLQELVLSYTKLDIPQNSAVHCFHSEHCFFICNTMIVSPVLVSEEAVWQTPYRGQEVIASGVPWSGILGPVHLLYMQYVATEQLFSRSHREQQVRLQENKGTER